jgi:hypothetical protein
MAGFGCTPKKRTLQRVRTEALQAHDPRGGFNKPALLAVSCTSGQLKHVMPHVHTADHKSFPCILLLCAVPSAKCVNVVPPGLCSSSVENLFKTHIESDGQLLGNSSVDHPLLPRIFLPEKR